MCCFSLEDVWISFRLLGATASRLFDLQLLSTGIPLSSVTKRFETPTEWNLDFTNQTYFADLVALFPISDYENFPSISELNQLAMEHGQLDHQFVEDEISQTLNPDNLYYEQFIYHKHMVPTRKDNWHDLHIRSV